MRSFADSETHSLLLFCLLFTAGGAMFLINRYDSPWIGTLVLAGLLITFMRIIPLKIDQKKDVRPGNLEILAYSIVIVIGIVFRFYKLNTYLPFFNLETSRYALILNDIMHGTHYFPRTPWCCECDESMVLYLTVPFSLVWGISYPVLRAIGAGFSVALIPAVYYFTRKCYDKRTAWIAAVLTSCSSWLIQNAHEYHRIRFEFGTALGITAMAILIDSKHKPIQSSIGAGLLTAFAMYLQTSNALIIFICFAFLFSRLIKRKPNAGKIAVVYCLICTAVVFHSLASFKQNTHAFGSKMNHFIHSKSIQITKVDSPKKHQLLLPPDLRNRPGNRGILMLRNTFEIFTSFLWRPLEHFFEMKTELVPIFTPLLSVLFLFGFAQILRQRLAHPGAFPLIVFIGWLGTIALLKPSVIRTCYINLGLTMALVIAASAVSTISHLVPATTRWKKSLILIGLILLPSGIEIARSKDIIDQASRHSSLWMDIQLDLRNSSQSDIAILGFPVIKSVYLGQPQRYALLVADSNPIFMKYVYDELQEFETDKPIRFTPSPVRRVSVLLPGKYKTTLINALYPYQPVRTKKLPRSKLWKIEYAGMLSTY